MRGLLGTRNVLARDEKRGVAASETAALVRGIESEEWATIRLLRSVLWSLLVAALLFSGYFTYNLLAGNPKLGRFPERDTLATLLALLGMVASGSSCMVAWSAVSRRERGLDQVAEILAAGIVFGSAFFTGSLVAALLVAETKGFGWRSSIALGAVLLALILSLLARSVVKHTRRSGEHGRRTKRAKQH